MISDTHGLLRPQALHALEGSDLIVHAGDVGDPEILEALKKIAPVFAVRGNVDTAPWARALPETEVIETEFASIYVLHDVHALDLDPAAAGFHIVVSGHSHKPSHAEKNRRPISQSGKRRAATLRFAGNGRPPRFEPEALECQRHRTDEIAIRLIYISRNLALGVAVAQPLLAVRFS